MFKKVTLNIQQSKVIREICEMDNLGAKAIPWGTFSDKTI